MATATTSFAQEQATLPAEMNLEEFERLDGDFLIKVTDTLKEKFRLFADENLKKLHLQEEFHEETLQRILEGEFIDTNNPGNDNEEALDDINETNENIKALYDRVFLLIYAPLSTHTITRKKQKYTFTIEQDKDLREKQYKNFRKVFPGLKDKEDKKKNWYTMADVYSWEDIVKAIADFAKKAAKAKVAYVVFNGHGNKCGEACLEKGGVPLGQFKEEVMKLEEMTSKLWKNGPQFPSRIMFVCAQCYGHLTPDPPIQGKTHVTVLSSEDSPKTMNSFIGLDFDILKDGGHLKDAFHVHMNVYASRVEKEEKIEREKRERMALQNTGIDGYKNVGLFQMLFESAKNQVKKLFSSHSNS